MPAQLSLPLEFRPILALGVCLGNREFGIALVTSEHLVQSQLHSLRKIAREVRQERARALVAKLVEEYAPERIALVTVAAAAEMPLVTEVTAWLHTFRPRAVYASTQPVCTAYPADAVRRAIVGDAGHGTNRDLSCALADRFPALARYRPIPVAVAADGGGVGPRVAQRTSRERFVLRMFLAVAGALHDLDEDRRRRILIAHPLCETSA